MIDQGVELESVMVPVKTSPKMQNLASELRRNQTEAEKNYGLTYGLTNWMILISGDNMQLIDISWISTQDDKS